MSEYTFRRMTADELSQALRELGMTAGQLSRLGVAGDVRIKKWLRGLEEPPAWLPVFLGLLKSPSGMMTAQAIASAYRQQETGNERV